MSVEAIAKDKTFLPHGILHSFAAGLSIEETIEKLLQEHEKYPKLVPRVDKDEIEFWYNSFKNGNFDLSQQATSTQLSKLERLPVLEDVIHLTNAADQKTLRNVCKSIRRHIDTNQRLYDNIEVKLDAHGILVQARCVNTNEKSKTMYKTSSNGDYFTAALADFKQKLEKNHTKVKKFVVKYARKGVKEADRVRFLSDVTSVMSNLKQKLDVENAELMVKYPAELDAILKSLKPGNLKELKIEDGGSKQREFKISLASNFFLHLKHLDYLCLFTKSIDVGIDTFVEIPEISIIAYRTTPSELTQYKNKLLKVPGFRSHDIVVDKHEFDWPVEGRRALKPFTPWYPSFDNKYSDSDSDWESSDSDSDIDDADVNGTIPFQDGTGDLLFFSIGVGLIFKRKKDDKRRA